MKPNAIKLLLLMLFWGLSSHNANAREYPSSYVIHNVNLVKPSQKQVITNAWIKIENGKIHSLGSGVHPEATNTMDMNNQYLMPGFIDTHMHLTSGPLTATVVDGVPKLSLKTDDKITQYHARAALASGITSVFSPAGDPAVNQRYDKQQSSGQWIGPKLYYAGLAFDSTPIEEGSVYPTSIEEWEREVSRQKSLGVSYIKLYHGLSEKELALGITTAHKHGLKTIGHLDEISWQQAINLGIDALTHSLPTSSSLLPEDKRAQYRKNRAPMSSKHLYQWFELVDFDAPQFQALLQSLIDNKIKVDLTLVVNEMTYFNRQFDDIYPDSWYLHPKVAATFKQHLALSTYNWKEADFRTAQRVFSKVLEMAKLFIDAGVEVTVGSDSYSGGGIFWRELQLHDKAGVDRWKLLNMITSDAAQRLELKDTGYLRWGFNADFIILANDPLSSPLSISSVVGVVQNGRWHDPSTIRQSLQDLK